MTIINSGTEPVPEATLKDATANMDQFVAEISTGHQIRRVETKHVPELDYDGRFGFVASVYLSDTDVPDLALEVRMPGLPLEKVNFGARPEDNLFAFPRLYLNKQSWAWIFAVDVARALIGEAEQNKRTRPQRHRTLTYGYDAGLPRDNDILAAWGARVAITGDNRIRLLPDEQHTFGHPDAVLRLLVTLNSGLEQRWTNQARLLLTTRRMSPDIPGEFLLGVWEDITVKGDTMGSRTHLHVCAYIHS